MRKQNQQSKRYVDAHTQIELLCLELSSSILLTLVVGRMLDPCVELERAELKRRTTLVWMEIAGSKCGTKTGYSRVYQMDTSFAYLI